MFCISRLKRGIIHIRTGMKITILLSIAFFLIISAILIFYKPIYAVNYNGEFLGYVNSKGQLQTKINEYLTTNYKNIIDKTIQNEIIYKDKNIINKKYKKRNE